MVLITADVLNQEYQIASITSANVYTIEAKDTDGDEVLANSSGQWQWWFPV